MSFDLEALLRDSVAAEREDLFGGPLPEPPSEDEDGRPRKLGQPGSGAKGKAPPPLRMRCPWKGRLLHTGEHRGLSQQQGLALPCGPSTCAGTACFFRKRTAPGCGVSLKREQRWWAWWGSEGRASPVPGCESISAPTIYL